MCSFIVKPYSERFRKYLQLSVSLSANTIKEWEREITVGVAIFYLFVRERRVGEHAPIGSGSKGVRRVS